MKGKIFLFLFALPFAGVGLFMGYSIGVTLTDAWQMKQWVPVQATLQRAGFETHRGEDADTYEAVADYSYEYGGRNYTNDRVGIAGGSDNIGSYQQDTGRYLRGLRERREPVTVFVNPEEPSEAIIDRSVRWGMIFFKSIFVFIFGGAGLGIIYFLVIRAPKEKDPTSALHHDAPWLDKDEWQSGVIKSHSKMTMWAMCGFAFVWNLISAPLPFVLYDEITKKGNLLAIVGLLFPLVGIGLIASAIARIREWRRFGPAPITMDPFPGSIGGHVGGTIDVNLPYDPNAQFSLSLTNLYSYTSGSGKNKSRNEKAEWQDTLVAHVSPTGKGSRLSFRFDVPEGLNESDAEQSENTYHLWRLNLNADLPGIDINRDYEIPVYATGERSGALSENSIQQARDVQNKVDLETIEEMVNLTYEAQGPAMHFPIGRNLFGGIVGIVVGFIFALIGLFVVASGEGPIFGTIFGLVGMSVFVASFYVVLNSLSIVQEGGSIRTVRRIAGIPVRFRKMRRSDFVMFRKKVSSKTRSGNEHTMNYTITAVDRHGRKMIMGEGFQNARQTDVAADFIAKTFGLVRKRSAPVPDMGVEDDNLLTTD